MINSLRANVALPQQPPQRPVQSAQEACKTMDSQNKGYVTQAEFEKSAPPSISPEGAQRSAQAQAQAHAQTQTQTQTQTRPARPRPLPSSTATTMASSPVLNSRPVRPRDLWAARAGPAAHQAARQARPPPRPASASGNTQYEAADSNEDGSVSAAEQQAYDSKQAASAAASAGTSAKKQAQLQLYRPVDSLASQAA